MAKIQPGIESALQREIQQTRPFHSLGAETIVGIIRTASVIERRLNAIVAREGITQPQYNVLRILRGAGDAGIPTLAIRDRMLDASPGVTRLIDRLEKSAFARRERSAADRRQVMCYITSAGLALLARLDKPVGAYDDESVEMLTTAEKQQLNRMLAAIRRGNI